MQGSSDSASRSDHFQRRSSLGASGELAVCDHLERIGWEVIATNVRCGHGEIDIVARDRSVLVICEVKTLRVSDGSNISPLESIGWKKRRSLRKTTVAWLSGHAAHDSDGSQVVPPRGSHELRFDVFSVTVDRKSGFTAIEHVPGAF
jgi:putative endonuclease